MKVFIVFATALLAVSALPAQQHWTLFKAQHGKSYGSLDEEKLRFQVFQDNVKKINAHNARYEAGLETYTMGTNKFADLTSEEFGALLRRQNDPVTSMNLTRHVQTLVAPESIDWREKNAVLGIKDQGACGSGWAFSTTGAIEGQNALKNNQRGPLSEQQLVDCDTLNLGCVSGTMLTAMKYVIKNGLNSEAEYPYEGEYKNCRAKSGSVVNVTDAVSVGRTESALKDAVGTVGPISVSMFATPIQLYESGIFESLLCFTNPLLLNHGVLAVAYGTTEEGKKYWVIKNSWGEDFGEQGYFRLARDANQCGIALRSSYPILA